MIKKTIKRFENELYVLFRIMIGLLFVEHGMQKVLGLLGGTAQAPMTFMWFIGVLELVGGTFIALGLYTRLASLVNGIVMIGAFFKAHFNPANGLEGIVPVMNRGELALVYLACFIVITAYGSGKCGLEKKLFKKETF
ncbi:DoxX family protein [archaeon]|nr:DoxX family protein [archaeon]MBT4352178.1 DoxX family protein [archaeon]MBT4647926.1 DoxX family protein [archaeon]MBT7393160.1 DoxX family protein [archaeon]